MAVGQALPFMLAAALNIAPDPKSIEAAVGSAMVIGPSPFLPPPWFPNQH